MNHNYNQRWKGAIALVKSQKIFWIFFCEYEKWLRLNIFFHLTVLSLKSRLSFLFSVNGIMNWNNDVLCKIDKYLTKTSFWEILDYIAIFSWFIRKKSN